MKKRVVYLFPGQGVQTVGMGKEFVEAFSLAKETYQEAEELLSMPLRRYMWEGPQEVLTQTKISQVAIFVASIAVLRVVEKEFPDLVPSACMGLSLGEYSALVAAKRISFTDALLLVQRRGSYMQEACEATKGTMAAVLGMEGEVIENLLRPIEGVWIANYNAPGQIVLSGTLSGVAKGSEVLLQAGAKRVVPLEVSGAFHSPLMQRAQEELSPYIAAVSLQKSSIPFLMNVSGDFVVEVEQMRKEMLLQVTHSVRFAQGIAKLQQEELFVEMGWGKTLSMLARKGGVQGRIMAIEKAGDMEAFAKEWGTLCTC